MLCRAIINSVRRSVCNNARMLYCAQNSLNTTLTISNTRRQCNAQNNYNLYVVKRFKSHKKRVESNKDDSLDESDDEKDDEIDIPAGSKTVTVHSGNIRLDGICKTGFGMARSKIEEAYYASKIRINGQKPLKKSKELREEDEVDIILQRNLDNPKFLTINRIKILSIHPAPGGVHITLSRDKNLIIEDYEDPWSP